MGTSGGPGKIDNLNYGDKLEGIADRNTQRGGNLYRSAMPLYQEQVGQTLEAMKTGGVGAQIPIIQRAVEQSKLGTSNALAQSEAGLRGAGLAGTPYGQNILANTRMQGALQTSRIPTEIAQQLIAGASGLSNQGFGASQNYAGLGANTLGNLQSMDLQRQMANAAQFQAFMSQLGNTMTQLTSASMGACLHPNTPIETPTGDRFVSSLAVGDRVLTRDAQGRKVEGRIVELSAIPVAESHALAEVSAPRGVLYITPAHPLPDGSPLIPHPALVQTWTGLTSHTMDLRVDGPTGVYFALGLALGSTLDTRHRKAA